MKILITGGTGSLGSELAEKWYNRGDEITILSRDPHKQAALAEKLPGAVFILSDICNYSEVKRACEKQDILIHAAAIKQVDIGEYHPVEFARVNVAGTAVVANAWHETHKENEGKALLISSDKACCALNAYGASKKLSESIFRKFDYSVIRYGNVVDTKGSFLKKWEKSETITVRTPEPTRFFLILKDAIALIEDALKIEHDGIFVPHSLKAFSVWDVAKVFDDDTKFESLLPYEKQHEVLLADGEDWEKRTDLLSEIIPGWNIDESHKKELFYSGYAPKMSGIEVWRAVLE